MLLPQKDKINQNRWLNRSVLWLTAGFVLIYYFSTHEGIYYFDDLAYSEFAAQLVNGTFDITNDGHTFIHRPGVFVPTAFLYSLFGVNYITYSLWPLLSTLGCLFLVSRLAHPKQLNTALAIVLLGLTFYFVHFSNILYPDNVVALLVLIAAAAYLKLCTGHNQGSILLAIITTGSLFWAGLTKETAVVVLPFFTYLAIRDIFLLKTRQTFWFTSTFVSMLLLLLYFGWYYTETGEPFYRIAEMERANQGYDNHVTDNSKNYLARLLWGPFDALIGSGAFILVVFIVGGYTGLSKAERAAKNYWLFLFLSGYLVLCFASTSLKVYNPVKLDARMYNLLLPPLAIAASYGLCYKLLRLRYTAFFCLTFTACALYLGNNVGLVYGCLALYFAVHSFWVHLWLGAQQVKLMAALAVVALCLAVRPMYFIFKKPQLYYNEHQQLTAFLRDNEEEPVCLQLPSYLYYSINYFWQYKQPEHITILQYTQTYTQHCRHTKLLLINTKLNTNPSFVGEAPTDSLQEQCKPENLIWQEGPLKLYQL